MGERVIKVSDYTKVPEIIVSIGTLGRNWRPFEEVDFRISENMIQYVSNFVKNGDPNGTGLPKWEPVTQKQQLCLHLGDQVPEMMAPDIQKLYETQQLCPAFPYK